MTIKAGDRVRWTHTKLQRGNAPRQRYEITATVRETIKVKGELCAIVTCEPDESRRMVSVRELKKERP